MRQFLHRLLGHRWVYHGENRQRICKVCGWEQRMTVRIDGNDRWRNA